MLGDPDPNSNKGSKFNTYCAYTVKDVMLMVVAIMIGCPIL